jgi:integrase
MPDYGSLLLEPPRCALEQGQADRGQASTNAKARMDDQNSVDGEGRIPDLAIIDSKLRGCDVVALKVDDIAPNGYTIDRATVRQRKKGRPIKFELTDQTRQAVDDYLRGGSKKPGEFLFTSRRGISRCMTTRQ